eukprot:12385070-Karenia_brevis.AAC.1
MAAESDIELPPDVDGDSDGQPIGGTSGLGEDDQLDVDLPPDVVSDSDSDDGDSDVDLPPEPGSHCCCALRCNQRWPEAETEQH